MKSFQNLTNLGKVRRLRHVALSALAHYDLDVTRVRLITNDMNCIFRIDTHSGEKWILRVTKPECGHNRNHVIAEMDWLAALARDTTIDVPQPLPTRDHALLVEISVPGVPEARLCEIFSWVPGTDLADNFSLENMALLGELSAYLHKHALTYSPPGNLDLLTFDRVFPFPEPVVLFDDSYRSFLTPTQYQLFQKMVERIQLSINHLINSGTPMRIIHGDLHPWNVRYHHGILSPIDFEDLMWGWPVQDIATTLYYYQDEANFSDIRAAFQEGYQKISPWPERYPEEINNFIAARGIGLLNFIFQNNDRERKHLSTFSSRIENRIKLLQRI